MRAKGRHRVAGGTSLLEALRAAPESARTVVAIDRLTARPKSSKRLPRPGRAQRGATLVLRTRTVEFAPTGQQHRGKPPMRLQGMLVEEDCVPEGADPIQWLLLTTLAVDTPEACCKVVEFYARRWRIEDWHRIFESGCKVEELANRSAERTARAAAINLVIAWRVLLTMLLGREHPDFPPEIMFSEPEIPMLNAFAAQLGHEAPDTVAKAVHIVAQIGGYIQRARAPPPGTKVMWRDCKTLAGMGGVNFGRDSPRNWVTIAGDSTCASDSPSPWSRNHETNGRLSTTRATYGAWVGLVSGKASGNVPRDPFACRIPARLSGRSRLAGRHVPPLRIQASQFHLVPIDVKPAQAWFPPVEWRPGSATRRTAPGVSRRTRRTSRVGPVPV